MEDNRWCEMCGSDRTRTKVSWYYSDEIDEISLCARCYRKVRTELSELVKIAD